MNKRNQKLWAIALVAPSLMAGMPAKGNGSSCGSSSGGGDSITDVSPATGGEPGVFGATATVSAPNGNYPGTPYPPGFNPLNPAMPFPNLTPPLSSYAPPPPPSKPYTPSEFTDDMLLFWWLMHLKKKAEAQEAAQGRPPATPPTPPPTSPPDHPRKKPAPPGLFEGLNNEMASIRKQLDDAMNHAQNATNPQDQLNWNQAADTFRQKLQDLQNRIDAANAQYE